MSQMTFFDCQEQQSKIFSYGSVSLSVETIDGGDVWLSQKELQTLFNKTGSRISEGLDKINMVEYDEKRPYRALSPMFRFFGIVSHNASGAYSKNIKKYNLATVVRLGFRLNGEVAEAFQDWATGLIQREIKESMNPELTMERGINNMMAKGATPEDINRKAKRISGFHAMTDEAQTRGATNYGALVNKSYVGMTGKTAAELKKERGVRKHESFRMNLDPLEENVMICLDELSKRYMQLENAIEQKQLEKCCYQSGVRTAPMWDNVQELKRLEELKQ